MKVRPHNNLFIQEQNFAENAVSKPEKKKIFLCAVCPTRLCLKPYKRIIQKTIAEHFQFEYIGVEFSRIDFFFFII